MARFPPPEPKVLRRQVQALLEALDGPTLEARTEARLIDYLLETLRWGARVDLVAARTVDEFVDLSLADAVVMAKVEGANGSQRVLDVGTGGGAPGLPLIALLEQEWGTEVPATLVEPRTKRAAFLRSMVGRLNLSGVEVERRRSDELPDDGWEVAVSRATLPSGDWLKEGTRLCTQAVWVLVAKGDAPGCQGWNVDRELRYQWPLTGAARRALRYIPDRQ